MATTTEKTAFMSLATLRAKDQRDLPSREIYSSGVSRLVREYNLLMIDRGFAERRRDLRKLDRIDVRGIYDMPPNKYNLPMELTGIPDDLLTSYVSSECSSDNLLYCILPCFADGVMQLNTNLELHWVVLEADLENQTEDIELRLYHDAGCGWEVSTMVRARIKAPEKAEDLTRILHAFEADAVGLPWEGEVKGWNDVHEKIPVSELPWNESDKKKWQAFVDGVRKYPEGTARLVEIEKGEKRKEEEIGQAAGMAKIWASAILAVNILLWARTQKDKPVDSTGWQHPKKEAEKTESDGEGKPAPVRSVRTVGGVSFISEKPPRRVTAAGARNYKVASWKRRGHPRHYKNGKVVWIEESTVHRKAAKLPEIDALPVTLKVKAARKGETDG